MDGFCHAEQQLDSICHIFRQFIAFGIPPPMRLPEKINMEANP
jgi:hypothetical protein